MPISRPQTNSELPKNGASTRLAAISIPRTTAPETNTALAATAKPCRRIRHGDPSGLAYTATQGPASLPVAAW